MPTNQQIGVMDLRKAILLRISRHDAADFMKKYDLFGNIGLGVWHWALDFDGVFGSVVSYGTTCFPSNRGFLVQVSKQTGCRIIQLCRGATAPWAPKFTASRVISLSCKEIYKEFGPSVIAAYADPTFREIGTIYQACNAIYTGMTKPKGQANYIIHGRQLSSWRVVKMYGTRAREKLEEIDPRFEVIPLNRKHRYVLIASSRKKKKRIRNLLLPYTFPYPKREECE